MTGARRDRTPRSIAVEVLLAVLARGRSLDAGFEEAAAGNGREGALTRELCHGVLRWRPRLEALVDELLDKPPRRRDLDVRVLLLLGLYQLAYTRIPPHAAVSETVDEARRRRKRWAVSLLNGALRRYIRESSQLLARVERAPPARWAHPAWLLEAVRCAWPGRWEEVLTANNARPPMTLRVNGRRVTREAYRERLHAAGIEASALAHAPCALVLNRPVPVERLPGFGAGWASVQDGAAQLAAGLLAPAPGERVLDACAAPGGKAAHLLELQPHLGELMAVDKDERRIPRLAATLTRLGLKARVVHADVGKPEQWWDGRAFDRILLDAPCSATGVVRRHPDIKSLRRAEDIAPLASRQLRLLQALWPLLARGGRLLYATCSILPSENDGVVERFSADNDDVEMEPIRASWGSASAFGRQVLPGEAEMDGFYYAQAVKR